MKQPNKQTWRQTVAEEMIRNIEAGTAPWQKPWEAGVVVHQPHNSQSGKQYHGINAIWLEMQGFEDPRWMTLKQANEAGAQVRKGEKSTQVEYWMWMDNRPIIGDDGLPVMGDNGKPKTELVPLERPRVFYANVFNAEQIDGLEPYQAPELKFEPVREAQRLLEESGIQIIHDQDDRAFYHPMRDSVHLPDSHAFGSAYEYYATALHEVGHATGHKSRLARDFGPFGSEVYAKEELRAELTSYMLARELGLGHYPDRHASYVESWLTALKDDHNVLFQAARDADRMATWIQEPELRKMLERDAQEKKQVKDMERDQEKSQGNGQVRGAIGVLADDAQKGLSWFYDQGAPTFLEYQAAENADDFKITVKEKAALDIRKALHSEAGKVFYDAAIKDGFNPENSFFVDHLKPNLKTLASNGYRSTEQFLKVIENSNTHNKTAEQKRIYLAVPYEQKDEAKALGAKWDRQAKSWYAPEGVDLEPLSKWQGDQAKAKDAPEIDPIKEFGDELRQQGIALKGDPVMDGKWHRVSLVDDDKGKESGSYRGFLDGRPNGQIKNYKTDELIKWVARGESLSPEARAELQKEAAEKQAARIAERRAIQNNVAKAVEKRFGEALLSSPQKMGAMYLKDKGVNNHGLRYDEKGNVLVPARDIDGKLWSIQTIDQNGEKRFQKGGRKAGLMHVIDEGHKLAKGQGKVFIGEGYATLATIHEATKAPAIVAFDASNLKAVAEAVAKKYPEAEIVIAADNDHKREHTKSGNVGLVKGQEAADAVGAQLVAPKLTDGQKERGLTDWNDLANDKGVATVAKQIREQLGRSKTKSVKREASAERQAPGM